MMDKGFQPSWNFNTTYLNLLSEGEKKKKVGDILNFEVLKESVKILGFEVFWKLFFFIKESTVSSFLIKRKTFENIGLWTFFLEI